MWELTLGELGRMLRQFRRLNGESQRIVKDRLKKLLPSPQTDVGWDKLCKLTGFADNATLTRLEAPSLPEEIIKLSDIKLLADAYCIPALMFDSFQGKSVYGPVIHSYSSGDDFQRIPPGESVGPGARYYVPRTKLTAADNIAVVYFELDKGGHSISHRHPGDELLIVEKGSLKLRLKETGLRIKADAGDVVHFNAALSHMVVNLSASTTKVVVIRFLQSRSGRRAAFFDDLSSGKHSRQLTKTIIKNLMVSCWTGDIEAKNSEPSEVWDREGLGRFLDMLCSEEFRGSEYGQQTYYELYKRAKAKHHSYSRSRLERLHKGQARIKVDELPKLADVYGVEAVLFANFLFPAFRYAIAAHKVDDKDDWWQVPKGFGIPENVSFRVPRRRLEYSDVAIARVELAPGTKTQINRHPGVELVKPVDGKVTIKVGPISRTIQRESYAYYYSSVNHSLANEGRKPAKILVIRFLESFAKRRGRSGSV